MKYQFHEDAKKELDNAVVYYENLQKGLGLDFANEIFSTIQRIINYPDAWQRLDERIRRCLVNRFPFGVIYYIEEDVIIILAIMHLRKKPNYWKNRI